MARQLKENHPGMQIIFITGYSDEWVDDVDEDQPILNKPFTTSKLLELVREVLQKA